MRLGVISDTHGSLTAWERALAVIGKVDVLLHAGDVLYHGPRNPLPQGHDAKSLAEAINAYEGRLVVARGNCDADIDQLVLDVPIQAPYALVVVEHRYILVHHGHLASGADMVSLMRRYRADLVVTGHTHVPVIERPAGEEGGLILNPGSPALPKTGDRRGTVAVVDDRTVRILHIDDGTELASCHW
ncbi:MAG: phosphodiesterase [Firmicutes bacterium]|nr:phosphodiesterase [Bacillota bacterium]MDH7494882.1 phosphodiesterase [Bacillota bacterium]